jgi:hypothetical protein
MFNLNSGSVVTYADGFNRWVHAFVVGKFVAVYVNSWDELSGQRQWANLGGPWKTAGPGTSAGVVAYRDLIFDPNKKGSGRHVVAFANGDGHLFMGHGDGDDWTKNWTWADRGTPAVNKTVSSSPAVVAHAAGTSQVFYAFVVGATNQLCVNHGDLAKSTWTVLGAPTVTALAPHCSPAVVTDLAGGQSQFRVFATNGDGHLWVCTWDGSSATGTWHELGVPNTKQASYVDVGSSPRVVAYESGGQQWFDTFVTGSDGHLHVNQWDGNTGNKGKWIEDSAPNATPAGQALVAETATPGVLGYTAGGKRWFHAFVPRRIVGKPDPSPALVRHYWNGAKWQWSDHLNHPYLTPGAVIYGEPNKAQMIQVFVATDDGHLYVNIGDASLDGSKWKWSDLGTGP